MDANIQFIHQPLMIVSALVVVTITWSLSIRLSQTIVCIANVHTQFSPGTSVQVIFVWLVVVGQLPQFDARML